MSLKSYHIGMKLGSLNIPPAARVIVFVLGLVSAWVTLKHITTGVTHYGGVVSTRANEPLAYWAVVATTTFTTALLFCAALLKTKKRNESASANRLPAHTPPN